MSCGCDETINAFDEHIEELIALLREHDGASEPVRRFLDKHRGKEYLGEIQSVLDIKELLDAGLII